MSTTSTYVFLGGVSEVIGAGIKCTRFGERVELPPDIAEGTKRDGGFIAIPADRFDSLGIPPEQLQKFGPAAAHANAPKEFLEKKRKALEILHEIRTARDKQAPALFGEPTIPLSKDRMPNLSALAKEGK